jgi:hypothetical protein
VSEQTGTPEVKQTPAQGALCEHVKKLYKGASATRYAEEREWATAGYFDQLKQWLENEEGTNRLRPIATKKDQKWPMPVTNLFSKSIEMSGNALGAETPRMRAWSANYDAHNRRAADAAENVIDAANRESEMAILNPRLAHMVPLFGIAAVYDTIAFDNSTVEVPQIAESVPQPNATAGVVSGDEGAGSSGQATGVAQRSGPASPGVLGSEDNEEAEQPQVSGIQTVPTARLQSYLLTPFEFYLPRDAQDANMARWKLIRWRRPLGEVKELYPAFADKIKADSDDSSLAFYYLNTLKSLGFHSAKANESEGEFCTISVLWADWSSLPDEAQKKVAQEWENQPSEIYEDKKLTKLQAAMEYGFFAAVWGDTCLQFAENPWDGLSPITFFTWKKDAVSVYNKGLSVELIPLTKKLNLIDSLILREAMSSGTGKWLIPTTQTVSIPSGDPQEILQWDPLGEGKIAPQYIPGNINTKLMALREQVVADIEKLSFSNSVAEGEMPGSGTAFRALAYLGSKAEETRKTQRYLWEQQHELRAKLLIPMARKVWTEPRKAQVRGFNNRFGMMELDMADLDGEFEIEVIQDSSRPKTLTEKLQAIQMGQQSGLIDPTDAQAREYTLNLLGLDEMDEKNHLQFDKADRDLEKLKQGIQPMESPFQDWRIPLVVVANFTFTEEFEGMPDNLRNGILMWGQYLSQKLSVAQGAPIGLPPPPPPPGPGGPAEEAKKGGVGGQSPSHVLGQVPGSQVSAGQVQGAAIREAANVVPNSPSPTA